MTVDQAPAEVSHCGDLQPVTIDSLTCEHCGVWLIPVPTD